MRHLQRLPASAVSVVLLAGLTACSGGSHDPSAGSSTPTGSSTPSVSASAPGTASASASAPGPGSPSATPTDLPRVRRKATLLHAAILDRNAARTPEERAVVDAWMRYWQAATDTTFFGRVDTRLAQVSTGHARSSIVDYLRQKKAQGERVVGWAKDNVLDVTVTGDRARVHDCTENFTFSVDEEGTPATRPDPWYDVRGQLEKRAGRWVVTTQASTPRTSSCLP